MMGSHTADMADCKIVIYHASHATFPYLNLYVCMMVRVAIQGVCDSYLHAHPTWISPSLRSARRLLSISISD